MTTFKFNFSGSQKEEKDQDENEEIEWFECNKINIDEGIKQLDNVIRGKMLTYNDIDIYYVHQTQNIYINVDHKMNPIELAEREYSDLIAGKYEGGLKVWECTEDLIKYLVDNQKTIILNTAKVLDLGCGVGILGIYALLNGSFVTFQDYNKEIISYVTLPSVLLNFEDEDEDHREEKLKQCQFYSGDWASFNNMLPETEKYDLILTSETIYNESNYKKLIDLFIRRLSKDGSVYLAAKTCYFGVGGGLRQFENCIKRSGLLTSEVVWKNMGGIQREILKINRLQ